MILGGWSITLRITPVVMSDLQCSGLHNCHKVSHLCISTIFGGRWEKDAKINCSKLLKTASKDPLLPVSIHNLKDDRCFVSVILDSASRREITIKISIDSTPIPPNHNHRPRHQRQNHTNHLNPDRPRTSFPTPQSITAIPNTPSPHRSHPQPHTGSTDSHPTAIRTQSRYRWPSRWVSSSTSPRRGDRVRESARSSIRSCAIPYTGIPLGGNPR